jgi:hypothetical protein
MLYDMRVLHNMDGCTACHVECPIAGQRAAPLTVTHSLACAARRQRSRSIGYTKRLTKTLWKVRRASDGNPGEGEGCARNRMGGSDTHGRYANRVG